MAKKPVKKQPPPPRPSSSSTDEESPSPPISPVKKTSAGSIAAVLRKHPEPSLKPADAEKEDANEELSGSEEAEEDEELFNDSGNAGPRRSHRATRRVSRNTGGVNDLKLEKPSAATKTLAKNVSMAEKPKADDEPSESKEKESTDEESSEDSRNAARQPNPLSQKRDPQTAKDGKQVVSNASSSSDSGSSDGEEEKKVLNSMAESEQPQPPIPQPARTVTNPIAEPSLKALSSSKSVRVEDEEDEDFESEEESMADESSDDFLNTAPKENPSTQPQDSQNKQASNTSSSSGSGFENDEEDIEVPISDPPLEPLSNKPIDSSAQPVDKEPNSGKQSAASTARISKKKKKKRTAGIVGVAGGQENERFRRIWSNEDELALLQGILEYKERYHVIPYAQVHAESLLKSVKDSLSISVSVNQINDKVRRMKKRYNNTAARKNLAKRTKYSDPHNAAVFDLSKKIWDSVKEEYVSPENMIGLEKEVENIKKKKKESKHFAAEYPSLYWFLRSEHANNALVLQNHIPIANAKKLDEKCKKLEIIDIQLNMQKIEFLSSAVKLINDSLAKCL